MSGMRWTEDQLAARLAKPQPGRATASEAGNVPEATGEAVKASPAPLGRKSEPPNQSRPRAKGRTARHEAGKMNNVERTYAEQVLDPLKLAGKVIQYWFERFTFKIADDCRYTPDFIVQLPDGELEVHEVKGGFFEEDAKVKLKVAADLFPFTFRLCVKKSKKDGGDWKITVI